MAHMQSQNSSLGFLAGDSEAARLMRGLDWAASTLGAPETWPQSLRSVVGLMLGSKFPMFVAWGDELGFLYNDSYAEILGSKHPDALGRRFADIWAEIWPDISPFIATALSGEATFQKNLPLVMNRLGYDEQTWFTFCYSPVRDESGAIAGMFCACTETTGEIRAAKRREALLDLDDRLRDVSDTAELSFVASQLLGEALGAGRVGYGSIDAEAATIYVERNWSEPGWGSVAGLHRFRDYGSYIEDLRRGEVVAIRDVRADPRTAGSVERMEAIGVAAFLDVPVVEHGSTAALIFVHSATPRAWTEEEIAFVREVAQRTRVAIARRAAEVAQCESDARYRTLFENIDAAFCVVEMIYDAQGRPCDHRFIELNPAFERQTGLAGALGKTAREVVPDHEQHWFETYGRLVETGGSIRFENGSDALGRWFDVHAIRIGTPGQRRVAILFNDITDRKAAERSLRELNETLERQVEERTAERDRLWETSPDLLLVIDFQGIFRRVNPAWTTLLGYEPEELIGHHVFEFVVPEDHGITTEALQVTVVGGQPRVENRYRHKDGSVRWISWVAAPAGELTYATGRDVTAEKARAVELAAAEAARRDADALYRAYFENTAEALFVINVLEDGGFTIEDLNPAHQASVGLLLEDVRGKRMEEILPPELAELVTGYYRQAVTGGTVFQYRERFEFEGRTTHWDTVLVPVRDRQGRIFRLIGSSRDLTGQVAAEEQLRQSQKMEAMGQLTGGVAHDFNNLLTPIIGSLDMLTRRGLGSEREQRLIGGALQSAERAKTLVQRLLAFARRQPLQPTAVDLPQLVKGMAGLIGSTLGPNVDVRVELANDLPAARADAHQLEMALLNLAVNARDAMPDGGRLTISATRESIRHGHTAKLRPGHYIRLAVADTGAGMDDATLARAVEPFFSTKGIGKGTGLGLSMVDGLAAQLGGGMTLESRPGHGTTVELWLPISFEPMADDQGRPQTSDVQRRGVALLVDDEELVRMSTADMLHDMGYEVIEAASGEEALKLFDSASPPDLLVTDHLMPGISGVELVRELRMAKPDLPVLIVSGYAEVDGIAPDLPRLTKPFRKAELADQIGAVVG